MRTNEQTKPEDLDGLSPDEQKDLLQAWFYQNYEDPAERTPYESAEGGYIWIWGGPYDAKEELSGVFYQYVDESVIDEVVEELEHYCVDWAPTDKPGDYEDYFVDDISSITKVHETLLEALDNIEGLAAVEVPPELKSQFLRLLFANAITTMETFLSDAFIHKVMTENQYFEAFVATNLEFNKQKIPLSEVLAQAKALESTVKSNLLRVVWHNLERVSNMYKDTLGVSFPHDLGDLNRAVIKRHDIVHRNGKDKDGGEIFVGEDDVHALIEKIKKLGSEVDLKLADLDLSDSDF